MRKQSAPSKRDLDPESIKRRTEIFMKHIFPHKGMIYDIAIKYTYCQKHIEDNYGDILLSLFRYAESYKPGMDVKSWIYISAVRIILDANERNGRVAINQNIEIDRVADTLQNKPVSCNCLDMNNYREHFSDALLEALDSLPPIHKEALLLQQSGYKIEEIVEISFQKGSLKSKSSETIKSRLFLAKKKMRELLTLADGSIPILSINDDNV